MRYLVIPVNGSKSNKSKLFNHWPTKLGSVHLSANPATAATGVAASAVKGLGQKKIRLVKVRLKAGYQVLLKVDKE